MMHRHWNNKAARRPRSGDWVANPESPEVFTKRCVFVPGDFAADRWTDVEGVDPHRVVGNIDFAEPVLLLASYNVSNHHIRIIYANIHTDQDSAVMIDGVLEAPISSPQQIEDDDLIDFVVAYELEQLTTMAVTLTQSAADDPYFGMAELDIPVDDERSLVVHAAIEIPADFARTSPKHEGAWIVTGSVSISVNEWDGAWHTFEVNELIVGDLPGGNQCIVERHTLEYQVALEITKNFPSLLNG